VPAKRPDPWDPPRRVVVSGEYDTASEVKSEAVKLPPERVVPTEIKVYTFSGDAPVRVVHGGESQFSLGEVMFYVDRDAHRLLVRSKDHGQERVLRDGQPVQKDGEYYILREGDVIEVGDDKLTIFAESLQRASHASKGSGKIWGHNVRMLYSENFRLEEGVGNGESNAVKVATRFDPKNGAITGFINARGISARHNGDGLIMITYDKGSGVVTEIQILGNDISPEVKSRLIQLEGLDLRLPMEWHLNQP